MPGYSSRKFIAFLIVELLAFGSLWFAKMPPGDVTVITTVAIGAYMAGNSLEHFADKGK